MGSDSLTGALTRVAGENVGTYAIQQGSLAASANYALSFIGANFTINPASSATAVNSSMNPSRPRLECHLYRERDARGPGDHHPNG